MKKEKHGIMKTIPLSTDLMDEVRSRIMNCRVSPQSCIHLPEQVCTLTDQPTAFHNIITGDTGWELCGLHSLSQMIDGIG